MPKANNIKEDVLYDLEKDPFEKNNLIQDPGYEDIKKDLKKILLKYIKKIENNTPKIISKTP